MLYNGILLRAGGYADSYYTDEQYTALCEKYTHAKPFTKESLLYARYLKSITPVRAR